MRIPTSKNRSFSLSTEHQASKVGANLAMLACVTLTFASVFSVVRVATVFVLAIVLIFPFFNRNTYWKNYAAIIPAIAFIYYVLISLTFHPPTLESIYNGIVAVLAVSVFVMFTTITPTIVDLDYFMQLMAKVGRLILLFGLAWEILDLTLNWTNKTAFLLIFLFFILMENKIGRPEKATYLIIWLIQAYLSGDRTYLIAIVIFCLAYSVWPFLGRHPILGRFILLVYPSALILVPLIYVQLSYSKYRETLETFALTYTGSRFFSGRDIIWSHLLGDFWAGNLLIGGGHDLAPTVIMGHSLSAHNTFIAILTRMGFIGLLLFFAIFVVFLMKYLKFANHSMVRFSAAITIALLFKQSSEFSLVGNNIAHSLVSWFVFALGFIYLNAKRRESEKVN